jgi:DNA-directed RNA polymerase specialized sigma24 family protein
MNDIMLQGIPQKSTSMVSQAVRKYGRGLLQYIRGRVKVLEDAEDILQDIWYLYKMSWRIRPFRK